MPLLGFAIIALVFLIIFIAMTLRCGFLQTLMIYAISFVLTGLLVIAAQLIMMG